MQTTIQTRHAISIAVIGAGVIGCAALIQRTEVRRLQPVGDAIEVTTDTDSASFNIAVVCAGAWSAPLTGGASWLGARPTHPDSLPSIGRATSGLSLFCAIGYQHLGFTLATPTTEAIADLVAGRKTRWDITALDLRRFGG
jgi:glycine/D-amino acid oxidase-like deaminating enzyme